MIQLRMNAHDEERVEGANKVWEVQDDENDDEELGLAPTAPTPEPSESGEEPGHMQRGFQYLTGFGSDLVWNRVFPGPWS